MRKFAAVAALTVVFATGTAFAESFTGYVADAMCAKNPAKVSTPDHAACAQKCIKMGSPAVLVVDGKVYQVSNAKKLDEYAGKKVTVEGTVKGDVLTVQSVKE